jgi:hypothetical protein
MNRWAALLLLCFLFPMGVRTLAQAPAPAAAPESARAARIKSDLRDILRTGGFERENTGESWLARAGVWISRQWNRFTEWLRRLFSFGGRFAAGSSPVLPYVLVAGLILLIAYAIAYAAQRYRPGGRPARSKPPVDTVVEPEESAAAEPDAWIAAARRHAAAGDYRKAYRAVFIAILIRLDRKGAIRFERSKTNGDYVRALRAAPDLLAFLRPLANDFDARWYGHVPATEQDFHTLLARYDSVPGQTP